VGISWDDAAAFARWEGKRLPREDEWEKAASWDQKAGAKRTWPWGNSAAGGSANLSREEPKFVSVGAYAADVSPYGLMDMAGNAAEWVDAYYLPYEGNSTVDKSFGTKYRVVRGGNCRATLDQARTSHRFNHPWEDTDSQKPKWLVGFRCAVSADDSQLLNQLRAMEK
jgi:iron(II)-dependent oxidoreductase